MENLKIEIMKRYYKKGKNGDVKDSLSVKLSTLGSYIFLNSTKKCYGALSRLAKEHPELVVEINSEDKPDIIE